MSNAGKESATAKRKSQAHGLYDAKGKRINWNGRIVLDLENGGAPKLDPPVRLSPGEQVFAWHDNQLVCIFTGGEREGRKLVVVKS